MGFDLNDLLRDNESDQNRDDDQLPPPKPEEKKISLEDGNVPDYLKILGIAQLERMRAGMAEGYVNIGFRKNDDSHGIPIGIHQQVSALSPVEVAALLIQVLDSNKICVEPFNNLYADYLKHYKQQKS